MKLPRKSITIKISLLYILLAIANMAFFSIIIYENQIDLISENTKFHVMEVTDSLLGSLNRLSNEIESGKGRITRRSKVLKEVSEIIQQITPDFGIFSEEGEIIYRSRPDFKIDQADFANGVRAVTSRDFTGRRYYSKVDEKTYEIAFYIPFNIRTLKQSVLLLKFTMSEIHTRLENLYRIIILIIFIIAVFHGLFALLLFKVFVRPIKSLHKKSIDISEGDLNARAEVKQDDEIGELALAFNSMASSVQEKILTLQGQRELMEEELDMASKVQEVIFPHIKDNDRFKFCVFSRAAGRVSGDYYDIFDLGDSSYGFLIVDVQGHGVPAAMVTMLIKEKFRQHTPNFHDPSELFKKINEEIIEILGEVDRESTLFFTAYYFIIDKDNIVHSVDAGHIRPLLIRTQRNKLSMLKSGGIPMGISNDLDHLYETKIAKIERGDKIILFTDGIIEARNAEKHEFGLEGILRSVKGSYKESCDLLIRAIIKKLSEFTTIDGMKDDATILIVELK